MTAAREAEWVRRYDAGESNVALAEEFGVSQPTLRRIIVRRDGAQRAREQQLRRFTDKEFTLMADMSRFRVSQYAVAECLDLSVTSINQAMRQRRILVSTRVMARGKKHDVRNGGRVEAGDYIAFHLELIPLTEGYTPATNLSSSLTVPKVCTP